MKRLIMGVALLALTALIGPGQPGRSRPARQPTGQRGVAPPRHQPRFKYSSYGVWVRTMGPGYPAYRYTYRWRRRTISRCRRSSCRAPSTRNYTWGSATLRRVMFLKAAPPAVDSRPGCPAPQPRNAWRSWSTSAGQSVRGSPGSSSSSTM